MQQPSVPASEKERLQVLLDAGLLDTRAEPRFDRLTQLVQQCLNTGIVLISLIDRDRQWFKSRQGLNACETGRDISFCGHAILDTDIFEIPDARHDPRFADNPLVTSAPHIRFYAGAPLTINNQRIGTLCIIDSNTRQLNQQERRILRQFADAIEQEIADRLQEQAHQKLAASELMYRSVLEGTQIGTWQWNIQTGETVFNERWAQIAGHTLDTLAPISIDTWLGLAHPEDLAESAKLLERHFNGELAFYDCKCRMRHKDGHWIWVHDRGRVVSWTDDGKPLMMYGTHADITSTKLHYLELERVNETLKITQQRLDMASENALIGFWQASLKTGELWWSPVIYQIFGFNETTVPSVELFKSTLHPQDAQLVADSEQRAHETGLHDVVHRIIRPDGTVRWVHELARMLPPNENPELIMIGSVQDITERMQLQQMKDQFVSTVSHELRTPLTAINGALGLLLSGQLAEFTPKVSKLLNIAHSNSNRLYHLINDLLDIEKLTAGKIEFNTQAILIQPQLEQAISNLQPYALEYQVTLFFKPQLAKLQVLADSQRLQQILANLLSNAIKFSGPGKTVTLSVEIVAENIRVSVHDQGPGIPPEFQPRLFERFAQADGTSRGHKGGTGLGLAICKGLLAQMNGQIGYNTSENAGTTFYFELPQVSATISDSNKE